VGGQEEDMVQTMYAHMNKLINSKKDTKNKEHEKTQKQINELREDINKQQSETKDTKKEKYMN
jgi:hypothetical protein